MIGKFVCVFSVCAEREQKEAANGWMDGSRDTYLTRTPLYNHSCLFYDVHTHMINDFDLVYFLLGMKILEGVVDHKELCDIIIQNLLNCGIKPRGSRSFGFRSNLFLCVSKNP